MGKAQAPVMEEVYKKEFSAAMRAKGKLPRLVTDASEKYDKSYHETTLRIFPGQQPHNISSMLHRTEQLIQQAQTAGCKHSIAVAVANNTMQRDQETISAPSAINQRTECREQTHHHLLKGQLQQKLQELEQERTQRLVSERQLREAKTHAAVQAGTLQERMQAQGLLPPYPGKGQGAQDTEVPQHENDYTNVASVGANRSNKSTLWLQEKVLQSTLEYARRDRKEIEHAVASLKTQAQQVKRGA